MSTLLYNPDRKNRKQFIEEFVVRTKIFNDIFADIKDSKMVYPEQNYLLIGQRGLGKTTLLTRLKYAIEDDAALNKKLIPVAFSEEQYNISELVNLWEEIAAYLEDHFGYAGMSTDMQQHAHKENYEQLAFDVLIKQLDSSKKKLVLLVDNIGVLLKKFERLEINRLREILQTHAHIRIVGGSTTPLESISDYHQPLYEFFKVYQLKGLTNEESIQLLKKLAEVYNESEKIERIIAEKPGRVETIRTLSGGVPRTMAMLFQVFLDNEHGSSITDLERILDLVTPLYKHRMDDLPLQQQKIVDVVARNWDAVTVKELTERLRLDSKLISAQLRQLEKNLVIEKRTTKTKNHLYLLTERFFNIWYLMRYGRKENRQRVIWLVKFLEAWCDEKEIENRINNYILKIKDGKLDEETSKMYGEIYSFFEKINPDTKFSLKQATPDYISKQISMTEADVDELIDKTIEAKDWDKLIKIGVQNNLTTAQKVRIFSVEDWAFYSIIWKYGDDWEQTELQKNIVELPLFYLIGTINTAIKYLDGGIVEKDIATIDMSLDVILMIYKDCHENFGDYEHRRISTSIIHLLCAGLINKALNVFKEMEVYDKTIAEREKLLYHTALRLANEEIDTLDSYLSEKVDEFVASIKKVQNIYRVE